MCNVHRYHGSQRSETSTLPENLKSERKCMHVFFVIQYPNKNVSLVASDILHLLISYVDHLQKFPPETPKKIVEVRHAVPRCIHPLYGCSIKITTISPCIVIKSYGSVINLLRFLLVFL